MMNIYNICGKGTCADPPACLKAAIRKAHPSEREDGMYQIFVPGSNKYSGETNPPEYERGRVPIGGVW